MYELSLSQRPCVSCACAFALLALLVPGPLGATKVTLDPGQWGHPAGSDCVSCHMKASAGLTQQWHESAHQQAGVNCMDCHQADRSEPDAREHEGQVIATIVSPKDCGRCHVQEYEEQQGSVHAEAHSLIEERVPALAHNFTGAAMQAAGCDQCHGSRVKVRGDGTLDPATWPNSGIGRINPDGSKGSCSACHGRHRFSKAQAREPEACVRCHAGPDSPDKEIFDASKHGMIYVAERDRMNLGADEWVAGRDYTAAPTCVTCHMGAAGKLPATHDVGLRNAWSLNSPISERQLLVILEDGAKLELPASAPQPKRGSEIAKADGSLGKVKAVATPDRRRQAMNLVCQECHGKPFTEAFMKQFDSVVELFNTKFAMPAKAIMGELYQRGLLTPTPFDEPIELTYWELWHDEGARARHGASMASPNHAWWEGMYLVGRNFYGRFLPEARTLAGDQAAEVVEAHLQGEGHQWLADPNQGSTILGFALGGAEAGTETAGPGESAAAPEAE
jgi:hydroxylamine dehydrogenase